MHKRQTTHNSNNWQAGLTRPRISWIWIVILFRLDKWYSVGTWSKPTLPGIACEAACVYHLGYDFKLLGGTRAYLLWVLNELGLNIVRLKVLPGIWHSRTAHYRSAPGQTFEARSLIPGLKLNSLGLDKLQPGLSRPWTLLWGNVNDTNFRICFFIRSLAPNFSS